MSTPPKRVAVGERTMALKAVPFFTQLSDRELDVVGDEVERRVRLGAVEGFEVALEEAHAAARCSSGAGGRPIMETASSV